MNHDQFRIIFNRSRGQYMAVSEASRAQAPGAGPGSRGALRRVRRSRRAGSGGQAVAPRRPLEPPGHGPAGGRRGLGAMASLLCIAAWPGALQAQVLADAAAPGSQRPTVMGAANGVPVVNIQTPSAAGVSHNRYSQMDVSAGGLVLNNSRGSAPAQLAGTVAGNPWLARGEARVIVNEVRSTKPMQLNGVIEIAGKTADLVIASPSGLQVDGGGFLHAGHVTLATGLPHWGADGALQGFEVAGGHILVQGRGLDASQSDYTTLLARSLALQAGVWARTLDVRTGATVPGTGPVPAHAVDSSALGGLYANRITLLASEEGVGVRHQGSIIADELVLDVRGQLHNLGLLHAGSTGSARSTGGLGADGDHGDHGDGGGAAGAHLVSAQGVPPGDGALQIRSHTLRNDGWITSAGSATVRAGQWSGGEAAGMAAGWRPGGVAPVAGPDGGNGDDSSTGPYALRLEATGHLQQAGHLLSSGTLEIAAGTVDLRRSHLAGQALHLATAAADLSRAVADVRGDVRVEVGGALRTDGAVIGAGTLQVRAAEWSNIGGAVGAEGLATAQAGRLDNRDGSLRAAAWHLQTERLDHTGSAALAAVQDLRLQAGTVRQEGTITAGGRMQAEAAHWHNTGRVQAGAGLDLRIGQLSHQGSMTAGHGLTLAAGAVESTGTLAAGVEAAGLPLLTGALQLNATGAVVHRGVLAAGSILAQAPTLDLRGSQLSAGALSLLADRGDIHLEDARAEVSGLYLLEAAGQASLRGAVTRAGEVRWGAGTLDHRGASLATDGPLSLRSGELLTGEGGLVRAGGSAMLSAQRIDNGSGRVMAGKGLTVRAAGDIANHGGSFLAGGDLQLLAGAAVDNTSGWIGSTASSVEAAAGSRFINRGGSVAAADRIGLQAAGLDNREGTVAARTVAVRTGAPDSVIDNRGGWLGADQALELRAGRLDNTGGKVLSAGLLTLELDGDHAHRPGDQLAAQAEARISIGGRLVHEGSLQAGRALRIRAGEIELRAGSELAAPTLEVQSAGELVNRGLVYGGRALLTADRLTNTGKGQLFADELTVRAGSLLNDVEGERAAVIAARQSLQLKVAGDVINRQGALMLSEGGLVLQAASLWNGNAAIESAGDMRLTLTDRLDNLSMHEEAAAETGTAGQPRLLESLATVLAGGDMAVSAGTVVNGGGTLEARGRLDVRASMLHNLNPALQWAITETSDRQAFFELADGSAAWRPESVRVLWAVTETPEGWFTPWASPAQASLEPFVYAFQPGQSGWSRDTYNRKLLLPSERYPHDTFARYLGGDGGPVHGAADRSFYWLRSADALTSVCPDDCRLVTLPGQHYPHTDRIWSDFGVAPGDDLALDAAMAVFYEDANRRLVGGFSFVDVTTTRQSAEVTRSGAARMLAGGVLTLQAGEVLNDMSQLDGRQGVVIEAGQLRNEGVSVRLEDREEGDRYRTYNLGSSTPNTGIDHAKVHAVTARTVDLAVPLPAAVPVLRPALDAWAGNGPAGIGSAVQDAIGSLPQAGAPADAGLGGPGEGGAAGSVLPRPGDGAAPGSPQTVRPELRLPASSLHAVRPEASSPFLVVTDARFTAGASPLSSDVLLSALSLSLDAAVKRLGDGAYEQRLVKEQLRRLTGSQFLPGFDSGEEAFQALLSAGARFAAEHQLTPGVALSAAQMSQLTSDLVWLVSHTVRLDDGSEQHVLVPQVYLKPRAGRAPDPGGLIAGAQVALAVQETLINHGTIEAAAGLVAEAGSVLHGGVLRAADVMMAAEQDLRVQGGRIEAADRLILQAGRDLTVDSTLAEARTAQSHRQTVDRQAALAAGTDLRLAAGRDLALAAARVDQTLAGEGPGTALHAGRDLAFTSLEASGSDRWTFNAHNHHTQTSTAGIGTVLQAAGPLQASAGRDLTVQAASLAAEGAVRLEAGQDLRLQAGTASRSTDSQWKTTRRDTWSSSTDRQQSSSAQTQILPSALSGASLDLAAGRDLTVAASDVQADERVMLAAGRDLTLAAALASERHSASHRVDRSGVLSGSSGLEVSIGHERTSRAQSEEQQRVVGTTVGSAGGAVQVLAGGQFRQSASVIEAPAGDISITAAQVDIEGQTASSRQARSEAARRSGLTLAVQSPVLETVTGLVQSVGTLGHGQGQDLPARIMGAATVARGLWQGPDVLGEQLARGGALSIIASVGSSSARSDLSAQADAVQGSRVAAGGTVSVNAGGAGEASRLQVRGSDISAGVGVVLASEGGMALESLQERSSSRTTQRTSGASIGVSAGVGTQGIGMGWTAQASASAADARTSDVMQRNSHVEGPSVQLRSGAGLALSGAVVAGNAVVAEAAGDITITSRQDSHRFESQSRSASLSAAPQALAGHAAMSDARGEQAAVREASGLRAGDGGFQVSAGGTVALAGGVITSTEAAVAAGLNRLEAAGGVALEDVHNRSRHDSLSVSLSGEKATTVAGRQTARGSAGMAAGSAGAASVTRSAVSGLAGDTAARTGDATPDGFAALDMAAAQQQTQAHSEVMQAFGAVAAGMIGDYAAGRIAEARALSERARQEADPATSQRLAAQAAALERDWGDEGRLRLAAHTAAGALSGGLSGALGAAAGTWAAPRVDALLATAGVDPRLNQALTALASTAAGALAGGGAGASLAFNEVTGNYLTHKELLALRQRLENCSDAACQDTARAEALQRSQGRNAAIEQACLDGGAATCRTALAEVRDHLGALLSHPDGQGQQPFQPETANHIAQADEKVRMGLQLLAHEAAQRLGRVYVSPAELAGQGLLSVEEARELEQYRQAMATGLMGARGLAAGAAVPARAPLRTGPTAAERAADRAEQVRQIDAQRLDNNAGRDGGADPHSPHPNTAPTLALSEKAGIDQAGGTHNPHYTGKHGPYVLLAEQYERAMTGVDPQTGQRGRPVDASKFFNATDLSVAVREAEALYAAQPARYAGHLVPIEFSRPVGEGYTGNTAANRREGVPVGEYRWTRTVMVGIDRHTGKAYTAYPSMQAGTAMPDPLKRGQDVH